MLVLISKWTLVVVFSILFGILIGYFLAKDSSNEKEESTVLNDDLHTDTQTGIVSDDTFAKRQ